MRRFLVLLCISIGTVVYGQGLTKNAEGESTVIMHGANIGIDIGKTELSFSFNNLQNTIGENHEPVYGASVKGGNKEGISSLFKKGEFIPAATLDAILGYSFSNGSKVSYKQGIDDISVRQEKFEKGFEKTLPERIKKLVTNSELIPEKKAALIDAIPSVVSVESTETKFHKLLESDDATEHSELVKIKAGMLLIKKEYLERSNAYDDERAKVYETELKEYWQFIFFSYGGIQGSEFKRFETFNAENLSKSFIDESFRGGKFGGGINAQWRFLRLGFTYGYLKTNNFSLLTKKEYTLKNTVTNNEQSITEEKKITAYTGTYGEVEVNELNLDLIVNLKLDAKAKNHVLINPYLRTQLMSRNALVLPNSTNIGLGFYFFKDSGKFLGGFYTELPDINNNYEKAKPEADRNLRAPLERMTFGIVGKFTLNTILK